MLAWLVCYFFYFEDNPADVCNLGIMAFLQSKKREIRGGIIHACSDIAFFYWHPVLTAVGDIGPF